MPLTTLRRAIDYASLAKSKRRMKKAATPELAAVARKHLIERMGRMRGLPQKVGQMLSFSATREANDPVAAADFALLQEKAEPLSIEAVAPMIEAAWGRPLDKVLSEIAPHGHAASLGQVHRATLLDGRSVAIKVQYPGIRESLHADLRLLGWLSVPVGNLSRGFDLPAYREMIFQDLNRELDYRREAESQRSFVQWAKAHAFMCVPKVVDELSTENVLVTEWIEGDHWTDVQANWPEADRALLARNLVEMFLSMLFQHGSLHADLHPGNLRFQRTPQGIRIVLYDFGCVYEPADEQRLGLLRLIRATRLRNESPLPLFELLGFKREFVSPLADKLPALCSVLFEPFCAEYPYQASDWRLGERVNDILGHDRLNFRIAGPPEMVLLMRAFHGLNYYLLGLGAPVNWSRPLERHLLTHGSAMERLQLQACDVAARDFTSLARYLRIRVTEQGQTKVQLTCEAQAIDDLHDLLDHDLRTRIAERGIELSKITADVRSRGYPPGPVFSLADGQKVIDVRLD